MVTTYFLNLIMSNLFKADNDPAIPTKYYLGLSSTTPTAAGGYTEPSGNNYGRVEVTPTMLTGPTSSAIGTVKINQTLNFPESTGDWGVMTHYLLFDSPTVGKGNLLMANKLTNSRNVQVSNIVRFKANALTFTLKSG